MCDYSLHAIRNRLASDGERLVVHRFETGSIGLAADRSEIEPHPPERKQGFWRKLFMIGAESDRPDCAVCIPPGARLILYNIPSSLQRECRVSETEQVTFTQLSADENAYRDAVRFSSGRSLLLQRLEPGQKVTVLALSNAEEIPAEPLLESVRH
jgi:hypothetical protein